VKWIRRAVPAAMLVGLVIDTVKLRRRVAGLRVLADDPTLAEAEDRYQMLGVDGAHVDVATLDAARAHAHAQGLAALDLVPHNLPTAQALDLLREIDPATYRTDRLATGRGAAHAVLADGTLLRRAGITPDRRKVAPVELAAATAQLKLHAPAGIDLVVAPGLAFDPNVVAAHPEIVAALHGTMTRVALYPRLVWTAALFASGLFGPAWAAAVLGAWSAQPLLVFAGSRSLKPVDRWSSSVTRLVKEPQRLLATLRAARRSACTEADPVAIRRPAYQADLVNGTDRFFEPNATCCPWCGGAELQPQLRVPDLWQRKPGWFDLDRCQGCGHVFQNPRLAADGLEFYYRDFYDGLGEQGMHVLFSAQGPRYRSRAEALKPFGTPKSWLDVGTGHGHFCNVARELWPQTRFDGLDQSCSVTLAEHRGWIAHAYQGDFVDLAPDLAGAYDVVSMFHCLEHTPDPQRELKAARTALRPGGHLMIEVPDPDSPWAALLGKWWMPWLQPQHLHLFPVGNLRARLEELDFTVVLEQHAEAHDPVDLTGAVWAMLHRAAPMDNVPWRPHPPDRLQRWVRAGMIAAGVPVMLGAQLTDHTIAPIVAKIGWSNAYRIVARKR
jgi:SAM-dependent methyltransferase